MDDVRMNDRDRNEDVGKVWLAGAGPGDAGLLTVKAAELIEQADVIVYDALISAELLSRIPYDTETIYVGKHAGNHPVPQEEINQILVREAKKGKKVLRLKGGDPFVFGRGGEELETLSFIREEEEEKQRKLEEEQAEDASKQAE